MSMVLLSQLLLYALDRCFLKHSPQRSAPSKDNTLRCARLKLIRVGPLGVNDGATEAILEDAACRRLDQPGALLVSRTDFDRLARCILLVHGEFSSRVL